MQSATHFHLFLNSDLVAASLSNSINYFPCKWGKSWAHLTEALIEHQLVRWTAKYRWNLAQKSPLLKLFSMDLFCSTPNFTSRVTFDLLAAYRWQIHFLTQRHKWGITLLSVAQLNKHKLIQLSVLNCPMSVRLFQVKDNISIFILELELKTTYLTVIS